MSGYKYKTQSKDTVMGEIVDGTMAYTIGALATFSSVLWMHANEITTIGGLLVLACRLYVDVPRAYRKWKGKDE